MRTLTKLILRDATSTPPRRSSPTASSSINEITPGRASSSLGGGNGSNGVPNSEEGAGRQPKQWINTLSYLMNPFTSIAEPDSTTVTKVGAANANIGVNVSDGFLSMASQGPSIVTPRAAPPATEPPSTGPIPKAPTGQGGHVLYPNVPHNQRVRQSLVSIFGRSDDRAMPSLQYEVDWRLLRTATMANDSEVRADTLTPPLPSIDQPRAPALASSTHAAEPTNNFNITEYLYQRFVQSELDGQSQAWLAKKAIPSVVRGSASAWLQTIMSRTSANAVAGRGEMFVVSREQVVGLLQKYDERYDIPRNIDNKLVKPPTEYYDALRIPSLVDIGAGDGGATHEYAASLFDTLYATEDNYPMQWRLWQRGFKVVSFPSCLLEDNAISNTILNSSKDSPTTFDNPTEALSATGGGFHPPASSHVTTVIALMNVLDRADKAASLLKAIVASMARIDGEVSAVSEAIVSPDLASNNTSIVNNIDKGQTAEATCKDTCNVVPLPLPRALFLMAVVLPWCPFVETNTKKMPPSEPLPMSGGRCVERAHFETSLATLVQNVLLPLGLEVVSWTRVPYLCEGSATNAYYRLDDAILLMRRRA
eukprot:GILI01021143.1.p1 GENE.GILI01021143.1~~GILI01021143.1.p1  ORF type:complete len:593 (-),score=49.75 GILI01021143.1:41-1819(-)